MRTMLLGVALVTLAAGAAMAQQAAGWSATCGFPEGGGTFQACGKTKDSAANRCYLLANGGNVRFIDAKPSAQCAANPRAFTSAPKDYPKPPFSLNISGAQVSANR